MPLSLQIMRFKMAGLRTKDACGGRGRATPVERFSCRTGAAARRPRAAARDARRMLTGDRATGDRCRELFRLKLLGNTFAEIQKEMGAATINTVYTWDARCRKKLLDAMGGSWEAANDGRRTQAPGRTTRPARSPRVKSRC